MASVLLPSSSPIVSFRILFKTGTASDPKGKEGVAALTAAMLSQAGSHALTYEQIMRAMYPMATRFESQTDKEMTVFVGQTHVDNLERYYEIIHGMLLDPGWRPEDFNRVREDAVNLLKINLRGDNDEELGKEELYNFIYRGTSYGHMNAGTIEALSRMTIDDVKEFYANNYARTNLLSGLAGGYPDGFAARVASDFEEKLAPASPASPSPPEPAPISGLEMEIVEKDARGTAISFGFPIPITRSDPDWPALLVAQSYLGQHRSTNSHLFQVMRHIRGLNYGDYAYIEYFPGGMFHSHPSPNLGRHHQIFQIWIRPVEPKNALFALRMGLYELRKLTEQGITPEDFEATRRFLGKFVNVLTATQNAQLGYALDSDFYGLPEFTGYVRDKLSALTIDDVNRAIRNYLQADDVKIVVVTKSAARFKEAALSGASSPISYTAPTPDEVLEEDKIIERYELSFNALRVRIVPVDQVFQT
jgi:zinc protease